VEADCVKYDPRVFDAGTFDALASGAVFDSAVFDAAMYDTGSEVPEPPAPASQQQTYHFFPQYRAKTKKEVREERERLGIIPKTAAQVIERVAKQPNLEPLLQEAEAVLRAAIDKARLKYREHYLQLLQAEIRKRIEQDEEDILLLMH
jgi:hypothetical protein